MNQNRIYGKLEPFHDFWRLSLAMFICACVLWREKRGKFAVPLIKSYPEIR